MPWKHGRGERIYENLFALDGSNTFSGLQYAWLIAVIPLGTTKQYLRSREI